MFLWTILVGFIIGAIARFLMPGKDPGGIIITILLGIAGSAFAGWLGAQLGIYIYGEPAGLIGSVLGAMLLIYLYRALLKRG
jgi:uncharacterized membrane protein YeaQ/YmgE (transglycosylase-associated protein family)